MRKTVLILLMMSLLFATQGQQNIKEALTELEETTQAFLAVTIMLLFVGGGTFTLIGAAIYLLKLRGKEEKPKLWLAVALIIGSLGILGLISATISLIIYLLAPSLINQMMVK